MNNHKKNKLAIFASGNGTNALNLLRFVTEGLENTSVECLIIDNEKAPIIQKVRDSKSFSSIPLVVVPFIKGENESYLEAKIKHENEIYQNLEKYNVNWIALAGYMRILSEEFINKFYDKEHSVSRIINIHPSLLPLYKGKDAYEQAFRSGDNHSGITVHFVDSGIDTGKIILQEEFERLAGDTLEDFKRRGLSLEYKIYPKVIDLIDKNDIWTNL